MVAHCPKSRRATTTKDQARLHGHGNNCLTRTALRWIDIEVEDPYRQRHRHTSIGRIHNTRHMRVHRRGTQEQIRLLLGISDDLGEVLDTIECSLFVCHGGVHGELLAGAAEVDGYTLKDEAIGVEGVNWRGFEDWCVLSELRHPAFDEAAFQSEDSGHLGESVK